jgi:hypothetical protein
MAPYLSMQDADYQECQRHHSRSVHPRHQQKLLRRDSSCLSHPRLSPRLTRRRTCKTSWNIQGCCLAAWVREKLDRALPGDGKGASGSSGDFARSARGQPRVERHPAYRCRDGLPAIAEFLQWYLDEIERRYQEFNRSGLTEEDWQQSLRQQQRITSVVSEEMTNWADRLPGDIGSKFFKSAMSDSRKVLMPPCLSRTIGLLQH